MRLIQVLVPDDQIDDVTGLLDEEDVYHVRQRTWTDGEEQWLVEFPVPTDAVGFVKRKLRDVGIDDQQYQTITSLESASSPQSEALFQRFANDFDPLTAPELRSKARDMTYDSKSFFTMIFLSAVIAVAGLLNDSPAVVVGSMVIAPIVGPVLTASVGSVTGDREMLLHSVWLQAAGLAVAIVGAVLFSYGLQLVGYFPPVTDISSIELIGLRVGPNFVTIAIGLAAGVAGAFGLSTKGPTSLIGVMIAAALIPAAATVGIATAWGRYRIALGSLLLLVLTMILVNLASFVTLWVLEYRPETDEWLYSSAPTRERIAVVATALALVVVVVLTGVAAAQQFAFERTIVGEARDTLNDDSYEAVDLVGVSVEYVGGPLGSPETVTVTVVRPSESGPHPDLADDITRKIEDSTGRNVSVRVRFQEYQYGNRSAGRVGEDDATAANVGAVGRANGQSPASTPDCRPAALTVL